MPNQPSKRVLIFRSELLAISETFVLAQAKALTRFKPRFVGLRRMSPSLQVPEDAIVAAQGDGLAHKCRRRLYKQFGVATDFHRKVREVDAHLIHAHFATDGVLALPLARKLDLPLVVTLHGRDVTISDKELSQSWAGRLYLRRRESMWEQATAFLCVSDFIKASAIRAGFPPDKLRTHYIGVDRGEFRRTAEPSLPESVLFAGRLVEKKGLRLAHPRDGKRAAATAACHTHCCWRRTYAPIPGRSGRYSGCSLQLPWVPIIRPDQGLASTSDDRLRTQSYREQWRLRGTPHLSS